MRPNQRVSQISYSATLALDARAKELAASGVDVINMSVGQPDAPSPGLARHAAMALAEGGEVRYTPVAGTPTLREEIARNLSATRGVAFDASEITVCHGAKHALAGALLTLVEPGDDVVLFLPAWNSYVDEIRFAGGNVLEAPPGPDCGPDFDAIEKLLRPSTKGVLLNTPSNPSGYVWSEDEIRRLVEIAEERDLWILSDEIYARLVYDDTRFVSPVSVSPAARERTIVVDGASKTFAMTGYRIGFLAAPENIASAVARLHSQLCGCPNAVSQAAYQAALAGDPPEVAEMIASYDRRRKIIVEGLEILGLATPVPRGAFYAFPNIARFAKEGGSQRFCADLLEEAAVAIVPGSVFGMDDHVRLSFAASETAIQGALERMGEFLRKR